MKVKSIAAVAALMIGCGAANAEIQVKEIGSFHVGGRVAELSGLPQREIVYSPGSPPVKIDPNGQFEVEQMYAQYVKLANPKSPYPLLLWHGGGLSGVTFETKPDGKPGWQMYFLNRGFDVYVSDAMERGRASWARYPEIFKSEPFFRAKKDGWDLFRIGLTGSYDADPAKRQAFAGTQFPVESYDQFTKQSVPRWATNDAPTQAAYDAYVQKVCPCIILVHSQGGNFAFAAALHAPDKIKAIVAVETSGAPDPDKVDLSPLKNVPHLFIWGDNLDKFPFWQKVVPTQEKYRDGLRAKGGTVDWVELPKRGITGNTHMMMMDKNSDQIAAIAADWLESKGLLKK